MDKHLKMTMPIDGAQHVIGEDIQSRSHQGRIHNFYMTTLYQSVDLSRIVTIGLSLQPQNRPWLCHRIRRQASWTGILPNLRDMSPERCDSINAMQLWVLFTRVKTTPRFASPGLWHAESMVSEGYKTGHDSVHCLSDYAILKSLEPLLSER